MSLLPIDDALISSIVNNRNHVATASHHELIDILTQLEDDQSLYESQLMYFDSVSSMYHEEIIAAGRKMAEKVRIFANHGYSSELLPTFMATVVNAIKDYMRILAPPKVAFCPCLKPSRKGYLYQSWFFVILIAMLSVTFECEAVVLEYCGQRSLLESLHFVDYIHRMINIQNDIREISNRNTEHARESVRIELLRAIETVGRYLLLFNSDTSELMSRCHSRLESFAELLAAPAEWSIARHTLTKVIISLQQIMNSASEISLKKSTDSIATLNTLGTELGRAWSIQVVTLTAIESQTYMPALREHLKTTIRANEERHHNSHLTIVEAKRRWTDTKFQSAPRPLQVVKDIYESTETNEVMNLSQNLKKSYEVSHPPSPLPSPFSFEKTTYLNGRRNDSIDCINDNSNSNGCSNSNSNSNSNNILDKNKINDLKSDMKSNGNIIEFYPTIADNKVKAIDQKLNNEDITINVSKDSHAENNSNYQNLKNDGNVMSNNRPKTDKKGNNYQIIEDNS